MHRYRMGLIILALILVAGIIAFLRPVPPKIVVVTRTAVGFEPSTVTIRAGDSVEFITTGDVEYWPASDFHPTHQLYPEFDPKRGLSPQEQWTFTFARAGTWTYHDHFDHNVHGTVIVKGTSKESIDQCVSASDARVKSYCWAGLFTNLVREKGLTAAFDEFADLYKDNSAFQQNCHDISHILGKAAYDQFLKDGKPIIRPETSYCAYGFYHGFIEEMFAQNGSLRLDEGVRYCDRIQKSTAFSSVSAARVASYACYHGLGHAAFDSLDGQLWGDDERMVAQALSECVSAASEGFAVSCGSGVFNSLAIAYSARSYRLSFREPDATSICRVQKESDQAACYKEVGLGYISEKKLDFNSAITFIHTLPGHRADAVYAYIDDYVRHDMSDTQPADVMPLCKTLSVRDEKESCVHGIIHAFVTTSEPGREESKILPYCELFAAKDPLRVYCFRIVGSELRMVQTPARIEEICSALTPVDALACRGM